MFFKYLNLPTVPDRLLKTSIEEFDLSDNIFRLPDYAFYKQYPITSKDLKEYLDDIFQCSYFPSYQIIRNGISIHKDTGRTEVINYLIDTGGPLATLNIFDDQHNKLHSEIIKECQWHWIDVTMNHNVTNFSGNRIALSIMPHDRSFQ